MKDEIKEILDRLKDSVTNPIVDVPVMGGVSEPIDNSQCLEPNECKLLLDYITNLQEEKERLNLELAGYREAILRDDKLLGLQEYKQRNEIAIQYIKLGKTFENKVIEETIKKLQNDLLNILQGSEE